MTSNTVHIDAGQLSLVLAVHKLHRYQQQSGAPLMPSARWAVMSAHHVACHACSRHATPAYLPVNSVAGPMQRGDVMACIERTRLMGGTDTVTHTFGAGIRALRAEPHHFLQA